MQPQLQCPVCTLFLHPGMNMQQHLDTHPKDQVIQALINMAFTQYQHEEPANTGGATPMQCTQYAPLGCESGYGAEQPAVGQHEQAMEQPQQQQNEQPMLAAAQTIDSEHIEEGCCSSYVVCTLADEQPVEAAAGSLPFALPESMPVVPVAICAAADVSPGSRTSTSLTVTAFDSAAATATAAGGQHLIVGHHETAMISSILPKETYDRQQQQLQRELQLQQHQQHQQPFQHLQAINPSTCSTPSDVRRPPTEDHIANYDLLPPPPSYGEFVRQRSSNSSSVLYSTNATDVDASVASLPPAPAPLHNTNTTSSVTSTAPISTQAPRRVFTPSVAAGTSQLRGRSDGLCILSDVRLAHPDRAAIDSIIDVSQLQQSSAASHQSASQFAVGGRRMSYILSTNDALPLIGHRAESVVSIAATSASEATSGCVEQQQQSQMPARRNSRAVYQPTLAENEASGGVEQVQYQMPPRSSSRAVYLPTLAESEASGGVEQQLQRQMPPRRDSVYQPTLPAETEASGSEEQQPQRQMPNRRNSRAAHQAESGASGSVDQQLQHQMPPRRNSRVAFQAENDASGCVAERPQRQMPPRRNSRSVAFHESEASSRVAEQRCAKISSRRNSRVDALAGYQTTMSESEAVGCVEQQRAKIASRRNSRAVYQPAALAESVAVSIAAAATLASLALPQLSIPDEDEDVNMVEILDGESSQHIATLVPQSPQAAGGATSQATSVIRLALSPHKRAAAVAAAAAAAGAASTAATSPVETRASSPSASSCSSLFAASTLSFASTSTFLSSFASSSALSRPMPSLAIRQPKKLTVKLKKPLVVFAEDVGSEITIESSVPSQIEASTATNDAAESSVFNEASTHVERQQSFFDESTTATDAADAGTVFNEDQDDDNDDNHTDIIEIKSDTCEAQESAEKPSIDEDDDANVSFGAADSDSFRGFEEMDGGDESDECLEIDNKSWAQQLQRATSPAPKDENGAAVEDGVAVANSFAVVADVNNSVVHNKAETRPSVASYSPQPGPSFYRDQGTSMFTQFTAEKAIQAEAKPEPFTVDANYVCIEQSSVAVTSVPDAFETVDLVDDDDDEDIDSSPRTYRPKRTYMDLNAYDTESRHSHRHHTDHHHHRNSHHSHQPQQHHPVALYRAADLSSSTPVSNSAASAAITLSSASSSSCLSSSSCSSSSSSSSSSCSSNASLPKAKSARLSVAMLASSDSLNIRTDEQMPAKGEISEQESNGDVDGSWNPQDYHMQNALPSYTSSYDTTVARESWSLSNDPAGSGSRSAVSSRRSSNMLSSHHRHSDSRGPTPSTSAAAAVNVVTSLAQFSPIHNATDRHPSFSSSPLAPSTPPLPLLTATTHSCSSTSNRHRSTPVNVIDAADDDRVYQPPSLMASFLNVTASAATADEEVVNIKTHHQSAEPTLLLPTVTVSATLANDADANDAANALVELAINTMAELASTGATTLASSSVGASGPGRQQTTPPSSPTSMATDTSPRHPPPPPLPSPADAADKQIGRYRCLNCPLTFRSFKLKRAHLLDAHQLTITTVTEKRRAAKAAAELLALQQQQLQQQQQQQQPQPPFDQFDVKQEHPAAGGSAAVATVIAHSPGGTTMAAPHSHGHIHHSDYHSMLPRSSPVATAASALSDCRQLFGQLPPLNYQHRAAAASAPGPAPRSTKLTKKSPMAGRRPAARKPTAATDRRPAARQRNSDGSTKLHRMTQYLLNQNWLARQQAASANVQTAMEEEASSTETSAMVKAEPRPTSSFATIETEAPVVVKAEPKPNDLTPSASLTLEMPPPHTPLYCLDCRTSFTSVKAYDAHLAIHPAECFTCSRKFRHWVNLSMHLKRHLNIREFVCTVCPKRFIGRQTLVEHMNTHTGQAPLRCKICDRHFRRYSNLIQHRKRHHMNIRPKEKDFICVCGAVFHSEAKFAWHRETHEAKPKCCPYCRERFVHRNSLSRHIRMSHTERYQQAAAQMAAAAAQAAAKKASAEEPAVKAETAQLQLVFKTESVHCPVCSGLFQKSSLKAHMRTHAIAEAAATLAAAQNAPVAVVATNGANGGGSSAEGRETNDTSAAATAATTAAAAAVIAAAAAEFSCTICNKSFTTKWNLKQHKWIHASSSAKPYKCTQCSKSFVRESEWLAHANAHRAIKPYTCDHCGAQFGNKYNWLRHTKEHERPKAFKCDECGKVFHRGYYLTEHKRSHTGERPFECVICGKMSTTKTNHNKHIKIHHARDPQAAEV